MSNPGKALFSVFLLVTALMYIIYGSDRVSVDVKKETYTEAIEAASQIATMNIIDTSDINKLYDGANADKADIPINFEALDQFRATLDRLLSTSESGKLNGVSNINIPLVGFVTYDYILGVTYGESSRDAEALARVGYTVEEYAQLTADSYESKDKWEELERVNTQLDSMRGQYLIPAGYTLFIRSDPSLDMSGKTWRFTLGNNVYIAETNNGLTEVAYKIGEPDKGESSTTLYKLNIDGTVAETRASDIDMSHYLSRIGFTTIEELRQFVVMSSINEYLNQYSGVAFNKTALNTGSSLTFQLGTSDFSSGFNDYNSNSAVIDGPGMFSIIDIYKGSNNNTRLYERIASFGGSELVRNSMPRED